MRIGAIWSLALGCLLPSIALTAGDGLIANDKVRLVEAVPSPVPLVFDVRPTRLHAVVAVRPTDALGSADSPGKAGKTESFRWLAELSWEIGQPQGQGGAELTTLTTRAWITEPFDYISLPADPVLPSTTTGVEMKTFVRVRPWIEFDGRGPDGQLIPRGYHPYRAFARFIRIDARPPPGNTKVIGISRDLAGTLLAQPRPDPPSVDPVPTLTNVPLLILTGTKPANTALLVNGVERVQLTSATTWNTTKTLQEHGNEIVVTDRDVYGIESLPVTVSITLDTQPPTTPVVSTPPTVTATKTVTLSGTKERGTVLWLNGRIVVPFNDDTVWSIQVELQEGENSYLIEAEDLAGNRSLAAGSETLEVAQVKPVIGDLAVNPAEVTLGQPVQITYRLYAEVPPEENADLGVRVRIEDADRLVRAVFASTQRGDPSGLPYTVVWDGKDDAGQPVAVNTSYRVIVSADRVHPSTLPPALANANPKETAVVVTGSREARSRDGRFRVVYRPDDARVTIEASPLLSVIAGRVMAARALTPIAGYYRVETDRPFQGPVVGVVRHALPDGELVRAFFWDESQQDWMPTARANFNPGPPAVSFALPGAGIFVLAAPADTSPPRVGDVVLSAAGLRCHALDDGTGVRTERIRFVHQRRDLTREVKVQLVNGVHDVLLAVEGVDTTAAPGELYLEDWVGNGRLFLLSEGGAP